MNERNPVHVALENARVAHANWQDGLPITAEEVRTEIAMAHLETTISQAESNANMADSMARIAADMVRLCDAIEALQEPIEKQSEAISHRHFYGTES